MTQMWHPNNIYHKATMMVFKKVDIRRQIQEIDVSYGKSLSEKRLGYVLRTERAHDEIKFKKCEIKQFGTEKNHFI